MYFMVIAVGIIIVLAIVGPVADARTTRGDKLIVDNIESLTTSINNYVTTNKQLPGSLQDLTLTGDANTLVSQNLVQYKPNTIPATSIPSYSGSLSTTMTFYYQLCVNFTKASANQQTPAAPVLPNSLSAGASGYSIEASAYNHPAGNVCYKVETESF